MLLNRKVGKPTLLSLLDPRTNTRWDERVKPISGGAENDLLYERWVKQRRHEVDSLSGGRLAYVHVRAMDDASMRTVFDEIMGRGWNKDAVIVDTRFNGGGNIHEQLSDFLSGKKYFDIIPHGQLVGHRAGRQVDQAVDRADQRGRLLRRAPLPAGLQARRASARRSACRSPGPAPSSGGRTRSTRRWCSGFRWAAGGCPTASSPRGRKSSRTSRCAMDPAVMTMGRDQQIEAAVRELMKK